MNINSMVGEVTRIVFSGTFQNSDFIFYSIFFSLFAKCF